MINKKQQQPTPLFRHHSGAYRGPVGNMGTQRWHVDSGHHTFHVHGELEFTPRGTALIWCDCCGTPNLMIGLTPGFWGSIVAADAGDAQSASGRTEFANEGSVVGRCGD
jgi:hypothetical protein